MIEPCAKCGQPVRLGAMRLTLKRKRGIAHYIDHLRATTCSATGEYHCQMMKPYPKPPPYEEMIERWNADQKQINLVRHEAGLVSELPQPTAELISNIAEAEAYITGFVDGVLTGLGLCPEDTQAIRERCARVRELSEE